MKKYLITLISLVLTFSTYLVAQTNPIGPQMIIVPNVSATICAVNSQRVTLISNLHASTVQLTIHLEIVDGLNNVVTPSYTCSYSGGVLNQFK